jgi:hypothetical protein
MVYICKSGVNNRLHIANVLILFFSPVNSNSDNSWDYY